MYPWALKVPGSLEQRLTFRTNSRWSKMPRDTAVAGGNPTRRGGCKLVIKTVNDKITSYFPPSPATEDIDPEADIQLLCSDIGGQENEQTKTKDHSSGDIPTPDSTPTKDKCVSLSGAVLDTPHKIQLVAGDEQAEQPDCLGKENCSGNNQPPQRQHATKEDILSQRLCDSPKPTQPKVTKCDITDSSVGRKGRRGRGRPKGATSQTTKQSITSTGQDKTKSTSSTKSSQKKQPTPDTNQNLLTDYFPIRRSVRRTQSDIKKEHRAELEKAILENCTDGLKVQTIVGKGRGVVAQRPFMRGDFVVEYVGDLISLGNAKKREKDYSANPEFGCYMYYFTHNNKSYCLDATAESGKLGRLLNHSCKTPNCQTKVVAINDHPYLILVAARDIKAGEELLYDYGDRSKEALAAHPWLAL